MDVTAGRDDLAWLEEQLVGTAVPALAAMLSMPRTARPRLAAAPHPRRLPLSVSVGGSATVDRDGRLCLASAAQLAEMQRGGDECPVCGVEPQRDTTPDPRLVAVIAERLRDYDVDALDYTHDTIAEAAEDIAAAVWAWLGEGDEA